MPTQNFGCTVIWNSPFRKLFLLLTFCFLLWTLWMFRIKHSLVGMLGAWWTPLPHGLFNYRSRNRHRNLWDGQCVSSWWPLDWFGYLHELYSDIWFTFKSLIDGVCHLFNLDWLIGKDMAYGGLPFPGTGCPVPDVGNIYLISKVKCMGYCFYNCSPP